MEQNHYDCILDVTETEIYCTEHETIVAVAVEKVTTKEYAMTITKQVEHILAASVDARNSDKTLLIIYMQKFGMNLSPEQIATFREMPSAETIRRVRQKIQEGGQYQAATGVLRERRLKAAAVQQTAPTSTPVQLEANLEGLFTANGRRVLTD